MFATLRLHLKPAGQLRGKLSSSRDGLVSHVNLLAFITEISHVV